MLFFPVFEQMDQISYFIWHFSKIKMCTVQFLHLLLLFCLG